MPWHTGLQIHYGKADPKVGEQHIYRKYNAIFFKLQLLYSTVRTWELLLHSYAMNYMSAILLFTIANSKVGE